MNEDTKKGGLDKHIDAAKEYNKEALDAVETYIAKKKRRAMVELPILFSAAFLMIGGLGFGIYKSVSERKNYELIDHRIEHRVEDVYIMKKNMAIDDFAARHNLSPVSVRYWSGLSDTAIMLSEGDTINVKYGFSTPKR